MVYITGDFNLLNDVKIDASLFMRVFSIPQETDMIVVDKGYVTTKEDVELKDGDIIIVVKGNKIYKIGLQNYLW